MKTRVAIFNNFNGDSKAIYTGDPVTRQGYFGSDHSPIVLKLADNWVSLADNKGVTLKLPPMNSAVSAGCPVKARTRYA